MTAVFVLVAHVSPEVDSTRFADALHPTTVLPGRSGSQWVIVDPPPGVADAVKTVPGCHSTRPAWAIAVLLDVPEIAPILAALRAAARDTITVDDPDFGPTAYALFDSPEAATAALGC